MMKGKLVVGMVGLSVVVCADLACLVVSHGTAYMRFPCLLSLYLAFVDCRQLWAAEHGLCILGFPAPRTTWWKVLGYFPLAGMFFSLVAYGLWDVSDAVMEALFAMIVPLLAVYVGLRVREARNTPGTGYTRKEIRQAWKSGTWRQ